VPTKIIPVLTEIFSLVLGFLIYLKHNRQVRIYLPV